MIENVVDIFQTFLDSRLENMHTILPGKIERYEGHTTRKATVKPLIKLKTRTGDDLVIPPIDGVPVIFPSSSSFNLLFPIQRGDGCLILFSEAGIGNYINSTGIDAEADDVSRFSLTDAICIPGLWTFRNAPKTTTTNIELTSAGILKLMSGNKSFVLGEDIQSLLNNFLTACSTIVPGNEAANAAALTAIKNAASSALSALPNILSTKIKGQ